MTLSGTSSKVSTASGKAPTEPMEYTKAKLDEFVRSMSQTGYHRARTMVVNEYDKAIGTIVFLLCVNVGEPAPGRWLYRETGDEEKSYFEKEKEVVQIIRVLRGMGYEGHLASKKMIDVDPQVLCPVIVFAAEKFREFRLYVEWSAFAEGLDHVIPHTSIAEQSFYRQLRAPHPSRSSDLDKMSEFGSSVFRDKEMDIEKILSEYIRYSRTGRGTYPEFKFDSEMGVEEKTEFLMKRGHYMRTLDIFMGSFNMKMSRKCKIYWENMLCLLERLFILKWIRYFDEEIIAHARAHFKCVLDNRTLEWGLGQLKDQERKEMDNITATDKSFSLKFAQHQQFVEKLRESALADEQNALRKYEELSELEKSLGEESSEQVKAAYQDYLEKSKLVIAYDTRLGEIEDQVEALLDQPLESEASQKKMDANIAKFQADTAKTIREMDDDLVEHIDDRYTIMQQTRVELMRHIPTDPAELEIHNAAVAFVSDLMWFFEDYEGKAFALKKKRLEHVLKANKTSNAMASSFSVKECAYKENETLTKACQLLENAQKDLQVHVAPLPARLDKVASQDDQE